MQFRRLLTNVLILTAGLLPSYRAAAADGPEAERADTTIAVDRVQVTAIKQGPVLRSTAVASSILGSRAVARGGITALKEISLSVPNFHAPDYGSRMTSSIYVRGLGTRIDQPVIGLNVDNVPMLNKNGFDTELADIERIEVLRGPQSTLYGRNTMGGVVNVYTLSPLAYEGVRALVEYGSGNTLRATGPATGSGRPAVAGRCSGTTAGGCGWTTRCRFRGSIRGAILTPMRARGSSTTRAPRSSAPGKSPTTTPADTPARRSATDSPYAATPHGTASRRSPATSTRTMR